MNITCWWWNEEDKEEEEGYKDDQAGVEKHMGRRRSSILSRRNCRTGSDGAARTGQMMMKINGHHTEDVKKSK